MTINKNITIAVDAMGGDYGPGVIVEGSVLSTKKNNLNILLVGEEKILDNILKKYKNLNGKIDIYPSYDLVTMSDTPSNAIRYKKKSSIAFGTELVVEGKADAFVSAGNSGVVMAQAMLTQKTLPGIIRPSIATVLPTISGSCVLLDVGANAECKPKHLFQFAIMGSIYIKEIFSIESPRIGILSIGEEKTKGNSLTLETYALLEKSNLNFIGNIEGRDIPAGKVDVAVCDGFTGNIILKFAEGISEMLFTLIKKELKKHPLAFISIPFLWNALKDLRKKVDSTEYGGALLLGIDGIYIICHGGSNSKAISNAIYFASESVKKNINKKISEEIEKCME